MKFYDIITMHTGPNSLTLPGYYKYIKFYGGKTHPKDMGKNEDARGSCKAVRQYEGKARPDGEIVIWLWHNASKEAGWQYVFPCHEKRY